MSADASSSSRLRPLCATMERLSSMADARTRSRAVAGRGYTLEMAGCLHKGQVLRCFSHGCKQSAWNKWRQSGNRTTSSSSNASKLTSRMAGLLLEPVAKSVCTSCTPPGQLSSVDRSHGC